MKCFRNNQNRLWVAVPVPFLETIAPVTDFITLHKNTLLLITLICFSLGWIYANWGKKS